MIRPAVPEDAPALRDIYASYIETSITFEVTAPDTDEFRERIRSTLTMFPWLVWEENGTLLGFAYAHRYGERAAYQWGAELSVYLDRNARGRGIGKALYTALIDLLREQGIKTVYGCVTSPNEPSEALHRSLGFTAAGIMHRAGYKAGAWRDVVWYEKAIGAYEDHPLPPRPFRKENLS